MRLHHRDLRIRRLLRPRCCQRVPGQRVAPRHQGAFAVNLNLSSERVRLALSFLFFSFLLASPGPKTARTLG